MCTTRRAIAHRAAGVVLLSLALASCGSHPAGSTALIRPSAAPASASPSVTPAASSPPPVHHRSRHAPKLRIGSTGEAVVQLQARLSALGYWVGTHNGVFGDSTQQAVYALQKVAGIAADGVVGVKTQAALSRGVVPLPEAAGGTRVEVDLHSDVLMFVDDGRVRHVLNVSTGGGYLYTDGGITARAITPTGHFRIYREVDGLVTDTLGQLWRPKFFDSGFAIHGDGYVPAYPASHGCVRVSNEAIDWIWSRNLLPMGTQVWVYR